MASPFPGMDPYLEQFWGDVHHRFVTYACDQLQGALPGDLRARVEERVFVELPQGKDRSIYPDVRIVERGRRRGARRSLATGVAVAEPIRIRRTDEPATQGFIEIIDLATGRRVVTVIEVLSLANKLPGPGRKLYQKKQEECRAGQVNLVEIDLLRDGPWVLAIPEGMVPVSYRAPYRVCVSRAADREAFGEVYRLPLRERLPVIKVPLRETDEDVPLDLQALIDMCYRNGGYDEDIDYQADPEPPWTASEARWANALLRKQGKRPGRAARKPARPGAERPRRKR